MKYRQFGKMEWKISALSLIVMPLSAIEAEGPAPALAEIIRAAIDGGVNYLDLGYPYYMKRRRIIMRRFAGPWPTATGRRLKWPCAPCFAHPFASRLRPLPR